MYQDLLDETNQVQKFIFINLIFTRILFGYFLAFKKNGK